MQIVLIALMTNGLYSSNFLIGLALELLSLTKWHNVRQIVTISNLKDSNSAAGSIIDASIEDSWEKHLRKN